MHHARPHTLLGDDSILNCCLYFSRVCQGSVVLVSLDILLRIRARGNGIESDAPENVNIYVL
jgi:predicted ribonuclease YlaK